MEGKKYPYIVKMLYNVALSKRIIRKKLADTIGLSRNDHWALLSLSDEQFEGVLEHGGANESFIIR